MHPRSLFFPLLLLVACFDDSGMGPPVDTDTDADTTSDDSTASSEGSTGVMEGSTTGWNEGTASSDGSAGASSDGSDTGALTSGSPSDVPPDGPSWALTFDGDAEAYSQQGNFSLPPEFTVELWIRVADDPYYGVLIDTRSIDAMSWGWAFYIDPPSGAYADRLVMFYRGGSGADRYAIGPNATELETGWHHLAVTRNTDGDVLFFLDGYPTFGENLPEAPGDGESLFLVGRQHMFDADSDLWWRGAAIDEVHVSRSVRYLKEFVPDVPVLDSDTLWLWHFDEGKGDVAKDEVGGVPLQLRGTAWVGGF